MHPDVSVRGPRLAVAVLTVLTFFAMACSSTTKHDGSAPSTSTDLPAEPDTDATDTADGSRAAAGPRHARTTVPPVPFVTGDDETTSAGSAPPANIDLTPGRGVKAKEVSIGALVIRNSAEFVAAFGIRGLSGVDGRKAQDAIAAYINDHGGMAGRTAKPLYHELDATSTETYAAIGQAICEDFTRDRAVFALVGSTMDTAACLAKGKVIGINNADAIGDRAIVERHALYAYSPSALNYDRKATAWIDGLAALGSLTDGKYGLLHYDITGMPASIDRSLLPAAKRNGISIAETIEIHWPDSTPDAGATVAAIQNAVLRFKTQDISHVLIYDVNATLATFFMRQAESQDYRPIYGLESDSHLEFQNVNVPHEQLAKATAVGWRHHEDVSDADPINAAEALCLKIMRDAGIEIPDVGALAQVMNLCDQWFFLKAGLDRAPAPNAPGFQIGIESLGTRFVSTRTYTTRFAEGRPHDGVAATRGVVYSMSCECWRLKGPLRTIR